MLYNDEKELFANGKDVIHWTGQKSLEINRIISSILCFDTYILVEKMN